MKRLLIATIGLAGSIFVMIPPIAETLAQESEIEAHVTLKSPARLSHEEAEKIYLELKDAMADRYAISGEDNIRDYLSWSRYNVAPYISATHGSRYINSYANGLGKDYGQLPSGEKYPEGTVFAKDSVTVTSAGQIYPGAMFVMEKLAAGTLSDFADWRYVMILPDGTIYADTTGPEPEGTRYCHACHEGVAEDDYVFFVPRKHRASQEQ